MNHGASPRRTPISAAHAELGRELKRAREAAGKTMRDIEGYSSGHISNAENGYVMPSAEFVDSYIRIGGDRTRLRALYEATRRSSDDRRRDRRSKGRADHPAPITPDSPYDAIRAQYRVLESESFYLIDARRVIVTENLIFRIRAVSQSVDFFVTYRVYYADRRPGVLSIKPGTNCTLVRSIDSLSGSQYSVFELNEPARPGDESPQTISFQVSVNSAIPTVPLLRYRAEPETDRHAVRVQFSSAALPDRVWWFRAPRMMTSEVDPRPDQMLPLNPAGYYIWDFHDLRNEDCGLAWEFND